MIEVNNYGNKKGYQVTVVTKILVVGKGTGFLGKNIVNIG